MIKENIKAKILIIDDEPDIVDIIRRTLKNDNYLIDVAYNLNDAKKLIKEKNYDVILCDFLFPKGRGIDLLKYKNEVSSDTMFILLTGYGSGKLAIEALQLGAFDYLSKPFKNQELIMVVEKAIESKNMRLEQEALKKVVEIQEKEGFIYRSRKMEELVNLAIKVAKSDVDMILIEGETGVGKEVLAKAIHRYSSRSGGPFIEINCAALPENLLESELFGHEKGAFTDAKELKRGLFEIARNGTIFLDEIGEISPILQAKLLRVIENRTFRRVGGIKTISTYARIIAATNINLDEAVKAGRFRQDLYYRLKVISFYIPPLRERKEDILALIEYYMNYYNKLFHKNVKIITKEAIDVLLEYPWPGNVRELRNVVERIILLDDEDTIALRHIPLETFNFPEVRNKVNLSFIESSDLSNIESLAEVEKKHIENVLNLFGWNKSKAARILKISRKTLWEKIKRYKITQK